MQTIGERLVVLGVTGSGKSTLSELLAQLYGFRHIELDNLFWQPNWQHVTDEELAERVEEELGKQSCWIVDGNYSRVGSRMIWTKADTLIWLDYPLRVNFWRIWKRTWRRFLLRELLWDAGNTETLWRHFFTRESLFLWAYQSHSQKRQQYSGLFASPKFKNHRKYRLLSPRQTEDWLADLMHGID